MGAALSIAYLIAVAVFIGIVVVKGSRKQASETDRSASRRGGRR
jgi:hypothetical protein